MADKTQLFPQEMHDAIHTRLTHSHEVSAVARGIGADLVVRYGTALGMNVGALQIRNVSALMAAIGLVHDIGNPPFGHQGEVAIRDWFRANKETVFDKTSNVDDLTQQDFLRFDGNAQAFRLVTTLQLQGDKYGLNLTYGTLATLLKYTVLAHECNKDDRLAARRKPGYFKSEAAIVKEVWKKTSLDPGRRHPLTFLVEACDDMTYSAIDVEDTVKKDLASYADVCAHLENLVQSSSPKKQENLLKRVIKHSRKQRETIAKSSPGKSPSPAELDDLSMQVFRVAAISAMAAAALQTFVAKFAAIRDGSFEGDLLDAGDAALLRNGLKTFLSQVAFSHRSVLEIELHGTQVLQELMDKLWAAIITRADRATTEPKRTDPLSAYTYSRISENYRRVFEGSSPSLPMRYREAQLLVDMVAGMTDSFALSLLRDLRRFDR
jgi:dGTPase